MTEVAVLRDCNTVSLLGEFQEKVTKHHDVCVVIEILLYVRLGLIPLVRLVVVKVQHALHYEGVEGFDG